MENQPESARKKDSTKQKTQGNFDTGVASWFSGIFILVIYLHNSLILQGKNSQEFPKKDSQENIR